ncbi:MAG: ribosome biogenesis GTPase YqeH [Alicyclobacillaceae bacterium]|nr:ribosome biogenesis GTPase YqeH [Alicyclobacillaceae bacterium]
MEAVSEAEATPGEPLCSGCGAPLQSDDPTRPGYVPPEAVQRETLVCRRCYRIRHYGEFSPVSVPPEQYADQVSRIQGEAGQVLYVLDVFDLSGSLVPGLAGLIGGANVDLVVNKVDLLPPEVKAERLADWVWSTVESTGVRPRRVWFVSARTGQGLDEVVAALSQPDVGQVWVVGMANVGKSTLLNRLAARLKGSEPFTVSRVPGTTLGLVRATLPVADGRSLAVVDTPGLLTGRRAIDVLCADCLRAVVPSGRLKPRVYQLDPGQSLWLGGFARFDFAEGDHQPVVVYVSNDLVVHRTKLERAAYIGEVRQDEVLKVPCARCRAELGEHIPHRLALGRPARAVERAVQRVQQGPPLLSADSPRGVDVVLAGLGWIAFYGRDLLGTLWAPAGVALDIRPRLIGDASAGDHAGQQTSARQRAFATRRGRSAQASGRQGRPRRK